MQLFNQNIEGDLCLVIGLILGVDFKIRVKIYVNEFIKFVVLLLNDFDYDEIDKYKLVDKNGEFIFVKVNDKSFIKFIIKWVEVFYIFVVIYVEKFFYEIGNLI